MATNGFIGVASLGTDMARTSTKDNEEIAEIDPFESTLAWRHGAVAGLIAAVAMGLLMSATQIDVLRDAIPGLYGLEGDLVAGWIAHLVHGVLFGLVFAAVMTDPGLARIGERPRMTALAGIVYGSVLAVVGAGIVMPMWLGFVGFAESPPLPNITGPTLLWHALYGVVLGVIFATLQRHW